MPSRPCPHCGSNAAEARDTCPECGTSLVVVPSAQTETRRPSLGWKRTVAALISLALFWCVAPELKHLPPDTKLYWTLGCFVPLIAIWINAGQSRVVDYFAWLILLFLTLLLLRVG